MSWSANPLDRWHVALEVLLCGVALYGAMLCLFGDHVAAVVFEPLGFGPVAAHITGGAPAEFVRFALSVLGAVLTGWVVLLFTIARGPLRRGDAWAWRAIVLSTAVWFTLDTGMSMALGVYGHAVFNVGFLAALATPLIGLRGISRQ